MRIAKLGAVNGVDMATAKTWQQEDADFVRCQPVPRSAPWQDFPDATDAHVMGQLIWRSTALMRRTSRWRPRPYRPLRATAD